MADKEMNLKTSLAESKRNMKIGTVATVTGAALNVGISNLHIYDLSVLSLMSSFVVIPAIVVAFNANECRKIKKKMSGKVLKKEMNIN